MVTQKQVIEVLALFNKLKIENNSNLSRSEKELLKALIDELKKQVKR